MNIPEKEIKGWPKFELMAKRMDDWEFRWVWENRSTYKKSIWEGFDTLQECIEDYIKNN